MRSFSGQWLSCSYICSSREEHAQCEKLAASLPGKLLVLFWFVRVKFSALGVKVEAAEIFRKKCYYKVNIYIYIFPPSLSLPNEVASSCSVFSLA